MREFNVAIDGPAAAGKSTVARLTANRLGFKYIDTGAMYRAVTWKALEQQIPMDDQAAIAKVAENTEIVLETTPDGTKVFVDGEDITAHIRSAPVTANVSAVAKIRAVRDILVNKQKQMASDGSVVMDGRDIGTKVLPDAEVKIFLTASIEERARRRLAEMGLPETDAAFKKLKREIAARDRTDSCRSASPLKKSPDAVVVDTTGLTIEQVVEKILQLSRTKLSSSG